MSQNATHQPPSRTRTVAGRVAAFILLAWVSLSAHAQTGVALMQHVGKDAGTSTASTLAFPTNNAAGNWIAVVVRAGRSGQAISVSDSLGNIYRKAVQLDVSVDVPTGSTLAIFYAESIRGGPNTVRVSDTLANATLRFAILEYSGVATAGSLDITAAAQGSGVVAASRTTTSAAAGVLVLGAVMTADARSFTAGSGYAISDRVPAAPGTKLAVLGRYQGTATAASAVATLNASNPWGAVLATFKAAPTVPQADLQLTKTHVGAFAQGQAGAAYTLTATNIGSAASSGTVTVTDLLPAGLLASALSGSNWTCSLATLSCARGDVLAAGASHPPITLKVNVAGNAPASVTNTASVSGGGEQNTANNTAIDVTQIIRSGSDVQPPTAPGGLGAVATPGSRIQLRWTASTDNVGVTGYRVERCLGLGCTDFVETTPTGTDTGGMGPLTASANPNYFQTPDGRPLILNGSHTWNNLQDWGSNGSLQALDFKAYVQFLVSRGHNFTLLWYIELPKFCGFPTTAASPPDFTVGPHPWLRSGPGSATDGGPKFDLSRFDPAYFARLRARAQALNDAGIYVGVYTFTAEWVNRYRCPTDGYPFTGANNVNGIDDGGGAGSFTMGAPNAITAIQDAYVEKVIDTLGDLPNVLWIVSEEAPPGSVWWNRHQIAHIRAYESTKALRHPIGYGVLGEGAGGDAGLFNSNADWVAGISRVAPATSCGTGTPTCKVNVNDSDHSYFGMWNSTAQVNRNFAWQNFTGGNQVMFMDPYVLNYTREGRNPCASPVNDICAKPEPRWDNFRDNLGHILNYSRKLNLTNVTPRNSLCSTSNCLAQTPAIGAEYLVYARNGGSFTVNLSAMASNRTLQVEWLNPSTGATIAGGAVAAGSTAQSFTPPFGGDAVLYLVDSAGHAGAVPLATSYTVLGLAAGTYLFRVRAVDAAGNLGPYSGVTTVVLLP